MPIKITLTGPGYAVAEVGPPEAKRHWATISPMAVTEIDEKLRELGCAKTDIGRALHAALAEDSAKRVKIELTPEGYMASVRPPDSDEPWQTESPITLAHLWQKLLSLGCEFIDIEWALDAINPNWRCVEDDELLSVLQKARPIKIKPVEGGYMASLTSPGGTRATWESDSPMTAHDIFVKLLDLGCHQTDIMDVFNEVDPGWSVEYDRQVMAEPAASQRGPLQRVRGLFRRRP